MKKLEIAGLIILLHFSIKTARAKEFIPEKPLAANNRGFYTGGQASTNGLGLTIAFVFNNRITFRTGFETMKLNGSFNFNENEISYDATLKYKTGGVFLLADYFFTKRLYVSAGAAMNSFNPLIKGQAVSDMQYGDLTIPASKVGDFIFTLEPSMNVSPYLGAGFRKFLGKNKRVFYNIETGLYYLGAPKINIEATGLLAPTADPAHGQKEFLEKQLESYKFYPVIKFNIAIKLF